MRLDAKGTVAGVPALKVRALLRKWGSDVAGAHFIGRELHVAVREAGGVLSALVSEGLVAEDKDLRQHDTARFVCTVKGNAFAQASAAKPLRRATVERKLTELMSRMVHVNASNEFLVGVEDAYVYGSYLTTQERLGDLDVSLRFFRKETDPDRFMALAQEATRESGRRFATYLDALFWPERKVHLFLKQRSRVFSLHVNEPLLELDPTLPRRAIFLGRRPVAEGSRG
jgi:hypothetical protein